VSAAHDQQRLAIPAELTASLVMVRHGESTYVAEGRFQGRQDAPLSTLGRRQRRLGGGNGTGGVGGTAQG